MSKQYEYDVWEHIDPHEVIRVVSEREAEGWELFTITAGGEIEGLEGRPAYAAFLRRTKAQRPT